MTKLTADMFTATQWSTAADKAKFGNQLIDFIDRDFPKAKFTKAFYKRLSQTFGHIAHYDQSGFWAEQLSSPRRQLRFLNQLAEYGCYGQPNFTFSDVERRVQAWVRTSNMIVRLNDRIDADIERAERAQRASINAKFGGAVLA